jgi:hypothetical protein
MTEGRKIHDLFLKGRCPNLAEMAIWIEYYEGQGLIRLNLSLDPEKIILKGGDIFQLRSLSISRERWNKEMLNEPWAKELSPVLRSIYERREEDPGQTPLEWMAELAEEIQKLDDSTREYLEGVAGEYVAVSLWAEIHENHDSCPECAACKTFDPGI